GFDHVTLLEVLELRDLDAALVPLGNLANVVFEAAQRLDFAVEDDGRIADDACLGVTRDLAAGDVAAHDRPDFRDLEYLAHLGTAERDLAHHRRQHAAHGFLEVFFDLVDDLVEAQINAFVLGETPRRFVGANVEADEHGVRRAREVDVIGRNRTD